LHSFYEEEEEEARKQWETYEVESHASSSKIENMSTHFETQQTKKASMVDECISSKKEVLEEIQEVHSSPEQIVSALVKEAPKEISVVEKKAIALHPRKMPNVSPFAQGIIDALDAAVAQQDGTELSNQVFDAECEGLEDQIDLAWYEQKAAELLESS
jgi:hypothetical protein